jgi:hypothetical protein
MYFSRLGFLLLEVCGYGRPNRKCPVEFSELVDYYYLSGQPVHVIRVVPNKLNLVDTSDSSLERDTTEVSRNA